MKDKTKHSKRSFLEKDEFLAGNRQKFGIIFILVGFLLLGVQVYTHVSMIDFLQYFTVLCGVLIGGLSGSAIVSAYKIDSSTVNQNLNATHNENQNIKEEYTSTETIVRPKNLDDGTID